MHFADGSIIADSHEEASGLMVITSGYVGVELPMDSEEADEEKQIGNGKTCLFIFGRGCVVSVIFIYPCSDDGMHRDSVGGNVVVGDKRWTGLYGVNVDLIARTHCSVAFISTNDILVRFDHFFLLPATKPKI